MDELAEDLLLLAARPGGRLPIPGNLRFGLAGAELVRLAAAGRVDVVRGRIVVHDTAPTGDSLLDEALASMAGRAHRPTANSWVARDRRGLVKRYLARAEAAGTIRADRRTIARLIPVTRWTVLDAGRAAQARARLAAVAASTGAVDPAQAALAGLAGAIDVTRRVFPGRAGRPRAQATAAGRPARRDRRPGDVGRLRRGRGGARGAGRGGRRRHQRRHQRRGPRGDPRRGLGGDARQRARRRGGRPSLSGVPRRWRVR